MAENIVSIRPSEMVEGGAVPVDRNVVWEKCRFVLFNYTKKDGTVVATTTAAEIKYKDDDDQEFTQNYSVGDPERFIPSKDGKTLVAVGAAQSLSKSSNFYLLMSNLVSAGYDESKLTGDISLLDGLKTYNIGVPEPKRSGLARTAAEGEQAREKIISVPSKIISMPGAKKGAKVAPKEATVESEETDGDVAATALKLVGQAVEAGDGTTTRQKVAQAAFRDKSLDQSARDAVAKHIFAADFTVTLLSGGYELDGENITKAE